MKQRQIGSTKVNVGAIGLGAMPLSLAGRPNEEEAIRVIHAAVDLGMTLIDTADVYCLDDNDIGHNERLIQKALSTNPARDRVLVATKGGLTRPNGAWVSNARPAHLLSACEKSLKALGVAAIDLYQLHAPDPRVPFVDSVGALAELKRQGKIRHVGLSNVTVSQIEEARALVDVVSVQNRANPFDNAPIVDGTLAHCHKHNITFLAHSPVGGHHGHQRVRDDRTLNEIATRHRATPYEVCLAWLLNLSPVVLPIPGASRVSSVESSARAPELDLTDLDIAELRRAFPWSAIA